MLPSIVWQIASLKARLLRNGAVCKDSKRVSYIILACCPTNPKFGNAIYANRICNWMDDRTAIVILLGLRDGQRMNLNLVQCVRPQLSVRTNTHYLLGG